MSSSISTGYSPTSNYSYPTDVSVSPSSPPRHAPSYSDYIPPPRLSSPHIFRNIFTSDVSGPAIRSPPRLPPLNEINFAETMQDVNRALQSANRAIQNAQEAFQSRRTSSANGTRRQDVVDLTNLPPSPTREGRSFDSFLSRTLHQIDTRSSDRMSNTAGDSQFRPITTSRNFSQSLFIEDDDPTSLYAGQTDSLAGPRRRFDNREILHRSPFASFPNLESSMIRSSVSAARQQDEDDAIRRQRVARQQWEINQQRQRQRERLQQQRDRILGGSQQRNGPASIDTPHRRSAWDHNLSTQSGGQQHPLSLVSQASSSSSVEAVDLTLVDNKTDVVAALKISQATSSESTGEPRSALTSYKCPICLEAPQNATSTICGHLFCYECIIETLKNSENMRREDAPPHRKVKGQCPVCRKELARREEEGNTRTLVPLEIKLISKKKMEELRRQERKRQRELEEQSKGKGREMDSEENGDQGIGNRGDLNHQHPHPQVKEEIFELISDDDEDDWGMSGSSQKENKAKRIKLRADDGYENAFFSTFLNADDDNLDDNNATPQPLPDTF